MATTIHQVDSFTAEPFKGNPAGVCILEKPADGEWMRNVAREMNLSETAFLVPTSDGYDLRWFTPEVEVDLCGHATLASAHILWEEGILDTNAEARFHTRSGMLTASRRGDIIQMDFPSAPASEVDLPEALSDGLGVDAAWAGHSGVNYLVEFESEDAVLNVSPDFGLIESLGLLGVIVTARSDSPDVDFVSRFFAPSAGINEDPVTGSSHCTLAPYWGEKLGKEATIGFQASNRGGTVHVKNNGDRVLIGGQAVTVMEVRLL